MDKNLEQIKKNFQILQESIEGLSDSTMSLEEKMVEINKWMNYFKSYVGSTTGGKSYTLALVGMLLRLMSGGEIVSEVDLSPLFISTASNGLRRVGNDVRMGGALIEDGVDIDGSGQQFNMYNLEEFNIQDALGCNIAVAGGIGYILSSTGNGWQATPDSARALTPYVVSGDAITGQFLRLLDNESGEVEFDFINKLNYAETSATYNMTTSNHVLNCTTNSFVVTLPSAVGIPGSQFIVKNSGLTGSISVVAPLGQTIDGLGSVTLTTKQRVTVVSTGSNYIII
jgi:hypothetical protein